MSGKGGGMQTGLNSGAGKEEMAGGTVFREVEVRLVKFSCGMGKKGRVGTEVQTRAGNRLGQGRLGVRCMPGQGGFHWRWVNLYVCRGE